uniref:Uncharacterized protein n=1 Tax=Lactuca sativa TaxID=4236 RepID=A0A9R1W088_LACSA|nr:hypothetical protein LSAT_V11C400204050 [Lactuca sativa]
MENEGIKNDGDKNQKKRKMERTMKMTMMKRKKMMMLEKQIIMKRLFNKLKNENMLDKFVDNFVDNVLGIGFSSLNSQEDEIWNDPEMKTILDNIDIDSPMTRSKTNTLISQVIQEKGKSDGVHELGKEVEKTKGDDTGKENSEHRNKRGAKAKNTKDGGAEKQIEIENGNAEDRGKKKSENENNKGEKADKTKGNEGDTHPSFSLGLSQDSDQTSSKKFNEYSQKKTTYKKRIKDDHQKVVIRLANKNVLNPKPISAAIPTEVGPSEHDLDEPREKKLADAFKSPFKCKIIDTKPKLTHHENVVVQTKYGQITARAIMESLYASTKIFGEVLDTWTAYLTSTLSDERKYENFKENFHDSTNGYKKS